MNIQEMINSIDTEVLTSYAIEYGMGLVGALLIFLIGRVIVGIVSGIIQKGMRRAKVDETLVSFFGNISYYLMLAFVCIAALGQLGVQTTSLAAIFAAAGLAIGLALQGSLSNLAAGVLIILFRPFKLGDFIQAAGTEGIVEAVSIFTTTISTPDKKKIIVPNNAITSGNIVNFSLSPQRRVDFTMGIGYDDDIKLAKETLLEVANAHPLVLSEPAATVGVKELADSSVNFFVRVWVENANYWPVHTELLEQFKVTFDKKGISIPYPQRDLHIIEGGNEAGKLAA